jgi:hypothetical protein
VLEVSERMPIDPGKLPSMLAAGVVVGLITVINALAFAGLIFAGPYCCLAVQSVAH